MIKKDLTFKDLNGKDVTETYHFSLLPTEIFSVDDEFGGLEQTMKKIVGEQDVPKLIKILNSLVEKSVGIRDENDRFKRSKEITENFMNSEAYSSLIMDFLTDPASCAEFCVGIIPEKLAEKLRKSGALESPETPKPKIFPGDYTHEELVAMSKSEFDMHIGSLPGNNIPRDLLMIAMQKR